MEVGPLGMALYVAAICYCRRNMTDGFIPARAMKMLIDTDGISFEGVPVTVASLVTHLIDVQLFEHVDGGYMVHDYLQHQTSREEIEQLRIARSEAGKKGGRPRKNDENQADFVP
jgi:hypothetical protein